MRIVEIQLSQECIFCPQRKFLSSYPLKMNNFAFGGLTFFFSIFCSFLVTMIASGEERIEENRVLCKVELFLSLKY